MKKFIKSTLILGLALFTMVTICKSPLYAANNPESEHKNIIRDYIAQIQVLQNQVFYLLQFTVDNNTTSPSQLKSNIEEINDDIATLEQDISSYLKSIQKDASKNREAALALNALNLVKNELYQTSLLLSEQNPVQKTLLLEDFFVFKTKTSDLLSILERIISRS